MTSEIAFAEPRWDLEPFTDVRYVGWFDTGARVIFRAALLLVLDGKAAAARIGAAIGPDPGTASQRLEDEVTKLVARLRALSVEQRVSLFATIAADETIDTYLHIQRLEEEQPPAAPA